MRTVGHTQSGEIDLYVIIKIKIKNQGVVISIKIQMKFVKILNIYINLM